ncbi:MAG: hypothetical protein AAFO87_17405, partial [Cyanobacteria bacterium J06607_6]
SKSSHQANFKVSPITLTEVKYEFGDYNHPNLTKGCHSKNRAFKFRIKRPVFPVFCFERPANTDFSA